MQGEVQGATIVDHGRWWQNIQFGIVGRALNGGLSLEVSLKIIKHTIYFWASHRA